MCAALRVTRRRDVPRATVGGRIAGTISPCSSIAAAAATARASSPHTKGTIGDGWPSRTRSTFARRRATSAAPSAERRTRRAASAAARVGGRGCGGEDVRPSEVLDQLDVAPGPGDESAQRTEELGARPDAQHVGVGVRRSTVGTEHGVRLVEHEQRVLLRTDLDERGEVGDVAVHREDGVAHDERAPAAAVAEQVAQVFEVAVAVHRGVGAREAAAVDDRRVVELVGVHDRARGAERGEHAEVRGEPGREERRRVPRPSTLRARASSSVWIGRDPTMSRAEPLPAPHRSSASCAAAITAGCAVSPR